MKKVIAAIILKEDKLLITQRSLNDQLSLKWEFPGGKIEEFETPEECLKREIFEELSIDIEVVSFFMSSIYKYEFGEIELCTYFCKVISGQIHLNVHHDFRWIGYKDLVNFEYCPADIEIVNELSIYLGKK